MVDKKNPHRRKHKRLDLELAVELSIPAGHCYKGKTTNISFGGVMANFMERPVAEIDDDVTICITFEKFNGEPVMIQLNCRIIKKVDDNTLCLHFHRVQQIDIDSYNQFTELMILYCPDVEDLLEELFNDSVTITSNAGDTG